MGLEKRIKSRCVKNENRMKKIRIRIKLQLFRTADSKTGSKKLLYRGFLFYADSKTGGKKYFT